MRGLSTLIVAISSVGVVAIAGAPSAWAQAGTTATPPAVNQATQGQMDAAKKAMEMERRRIEEEEKAKRAAETKSQLKK